MAPAEPLEFICQLGGEFDVIQNGIKFLQLVSLLRILRKVNIKHQLLIQRWGQYKATEMKKGIQTPL